MRVLFVFIYIFLVVFVEVFKYIVYNFDGVIENSVVTIYRVFFFGSFKFNFGSGCFIIVLFRFYFRGGYFRFYFVC